MSKENTRARFTSIANSKEEDIRLDEAALVIAAETESDFSIESYLTKLDEMALRFENLDSKATQFGVPLASLIEFIHKEENFTGNVRDYYQPANSYLNRVIDTRVGIPISLALIHIALAERLNIPIEGVNFPGHFLIKYGSEPNLMVDPFSGRILSEPDCATLLKQIAGPKAVLQPHYFDAASKKDILIRILDNLKQIFWQRKAWDQSKLCIERQLLLRPDEGEYTVQLGAVYEMQGDLQLAQHTYTDVVQHSEDEQMRKIASKRLLAMQPDSPTIH